MRIEIAVRGGIGELGLTAVGLPGAGLSAMTLLSVPAQDLQLLLQRLLAGGTEVLAVGDVRHAYGMAALPTPPRYWSSSPS